MIVAPNITDFLKIELPRRPWIIDHFLPGDGWTLLHGAAKTGKSTLAYQLAKALATHTPFLQPQWKADRPYKVVYLQADASATEWQEFLKDESAPVGQVTDLDFGCFYWPTPHNQIKEALAKLEAEVVVIDSAYKIKGGDQDLNEGKGVTNLLTNIHKAYDGPYVLIHHSRKQGVAQPRDAIESAAGHHTLTANASAIWYLTRNDKGTHGSLSYLGRGVPIGEVPLERLPNGYWVPGQPQEDVVPRGIKF